MSIDLDWERLTGGPDGGALAETVRAFIHDRFQRVELPRMIRGVAVHAFDFGSVAPEITLKDVCDPLTDFYDDDDDSSGGESDGDGRHGGDGDEDATPQRHPDIVDSIVEGVEASATARRRSGKFKADAIDERRLSDHPQRPNARLGAASDKTRPVLSRSSTPGIPGGTSNMSYFHLPLSAGLSGGGVTPFAAFGGAHGWLENQHAPWASHDTAQGINGRGIGKASFATPAGATAAQDAFKQDQPFPAATPAREKASEDVQIVAHVRYSGDVKLSMTADILLDYPMPSFVGIPLQLRVTGVTFDGVAVAAYIRHKAHFCFLSPEDAEAVLAGDGDDDLGEDDAPRGGERDNDGTPTSPSRPGALFEQIRVESEIGQRTQGKQVLKNVGKVEKFVLEQVRRIFETEFVYPSFWTFLV